MPTPSSTDATNAAAKTPPAAQLRRLQRLGLLGNSRRRQRGAVRLQVFHQGLQIAQGDRIGGLADPFPVLLPGKLAVVQGVVEDRAGVLPVAVFGAGRRCRPHAKWCPEQFRHADDRRSPAQIGTGCRRSWPRLRPATASVAYRRCGSGTYSGQRATAATGGGLRASAALPAGRGVLGAHRCDRGV